MRIPKELTPIAYGTSKKVYEKKLTFSEGQKIIVGDNQMNKNSAADYINDFRCLVEGKRFTRTLNAYSMEYFLDFIFKDYGTQGLTNALIALKEHIEYYEAIQKVRMHKMRDIYERYLAAVPIQSSDEQEQNEIVKEIIKDKSIKADILNELRNLKETDPETVTFKGKAFKRDNKTVAQIKVLRDFRCQFCGTTIKKKDGSNYIEAAHIKAKHLKGRETLDNIILLCPNHHKEFDFGDRIIISHTKKSVDVILNGTDYHIEFETVDSAKTERQHTI
ncbi:HNH endonuclease [Paraflavisolibacter sp. H34]|uniref:HNH endonuclease n=1 Tax=Huijunlia imazamoxiresistens TaxID=3127457 RepID=UPI003016C533